MKYKAIFERNADRLVNANAIYEGQVIVLPAKEAQSNHITKAQKIPTSIFRGGHFFVCADLLNLMTLGYADVFVF